MFDKRDGIFDFANNKFYVEFFKEKVRKVN